MDIEEFKKSLVAVRHLEKDGYELIVTQKHLLKDLLKNKRKVYLPDKFCKIERCKKIGQNSNGDWDCKKCILNFYGIKKEVSHE